MENKIGKTFSGRDIERSKKEFINNNNSYAIVANRLDGIDFPNDECRVLILFEIPTVAHIQEKFMITRLAAKTLFDEQIKTRVIQALGRCTRSQTDYAVICVLSEDVMNYLLSPKTLQKLNPELQAEIQFGNENSTDYHDFDELLDMVDVFLEHKKDWEVAEEEILNIREEIINKGFGETNDAYIQLSKAVKHEVRYQYALWKNDYTTALSEVERILINLQAEELKGYRAYWEYVAGCCSFSLFKSGKIMFESRYKEYFKRASEATIAVNWFKYEEKSEEKNNDDNVQDTILGLEQYILRHGRKGMKKFYEELDEIRALLKAEDGHDFENGHKRLGELSGYRAINPKGTAEPDPIWIINRELCIVSEDKIYKKGKEIPPNDIIISRNL